MYVNVEFLYGISVKTSKEINRLNKEKIEILYKLGIYYITITFMIHSK